MTNLVTIKQPRFVEFLLDEDVIVPQGSTVSSASARRDASPKSLQFLHTLIRDMEANEQELARSRRNGYVRSFAPGAEPLLVMA